MVFFSLLFGFADRLLPRLPRLQVKLEKLDLARFRRHALAATGLAAVVGAPPLTVVSVAAPIVRMPYRWFLVLGLMGRFVRFGVLGAVPGLFSGWVDLAALPEWVRAVL